MDKSERGVQQFRSTTVPKNAGKFQNYIHAFSKEREITGAFNGAEVQQRLKISELFTRIF